MINRNDSYLDACRKYGSIAALIVVVIWAVSLILIGRSFGRDLDGRFAGSPLKSWFDQLHSGKGPCCSDADGTALSDVDWRSSDGRYQVRIDGVWIDVPDDAVITEPNRAGRTMVWPMYRDGGVMVRCFMPGSMT